MKNEELRKGGKGEGGLTDEIKEEMIVDEARGFGAAVSVVDADEDGIGAGLDLAVILDDLVGLNHRVGEFAARVFFEVLPPHERVADGGHVIEIVALAHACISPHRSQARRHYPCQPRKHPTFPSLTDPQNMKPERERDKEVDNEMHPDGREGENKIFFFL